MSIDGIRAIAEKYQSKVTGKLGIGFIDLQTGEKYTLNGTELFPTASVCKVFTLAALYKMVAEGKADDTDRYEMTEDVQVGGSGVLHRMLPGLNPTLRDYAMLMMILSDNTAADFLFKFVGGAEGVTENVLKPLGLTSSKCDLSIKQMFPPCFDNYTIIQTNGRDRRCYLNNSGFLCTNDKDDITTVEDIMSILRLMYERKLYSEQACESMLDILKKCQTNTRIPKFLPPSVDVAHKTGTLDCLCNDVGIVYTKKGNYLLAMFYNGNVATMEEYAKNDRGRNSDALLADISKEIYDEFTK